jgi:zinc protease
MIRRILTTTVALSSLSACCPPKTTKVATLPDPTSVKSEPVETTKQPEVVAVAAATAPSLQTAQPQDLTFPDEDFRRKQPTASAPRAFALPTMQSFALKNGINVFLVHKTELPIVSIDLSFEGGSSLDPKGKEGLASLCMSVLTEGTTRLDKVALAEALGDVASDIGSYASGDTVGLTMSTLSRNLDETFGLFAETIMTPGMRDSDFERLVKRRIESIKQSKASPESLLGRISPVILYGANHPFGSVTTEASLTGVTLADCKAFATRALKPKGAKLFVVGDMDEARIRALFDGPQLAAFKGLGIARTKPPAPAKPAARVYMVDVPGAAQSQVVMLGTGPKRTDKDYFSNQLMVSVFGGGFTSRINMNLREDKGYSYGARGGFNYNRDFGTFVASASVRTDSSYQSLLEMMNEFNALSSGKIPVSSEELQREKNGITLALPARFATGASALSQYRMLQYYGLPKDYFNSFVANINAVTAPQTVAAAKKQLRANDIVYLVIGDANATVIVRDVATKKDVPLLKDGKPVTLKAAIETLVQTGTLGSGGLVMLDADGNVRK